MRHEQHCMKVAVAAPSCMPSSSEYRKTRQGDHVATQQQQNGNWSAGKYTRNGLLQKALLFLTPAPTPPHFERNKANHEASSHKSGCYDGKGGGGGADVTKSAAFRNGTRACTTMGISTAGEVGHYTESADFRNGTRRYAKTLRFCHIWPSVASVLRGR